MSPPNDHVDKLLDDYLHQLLKPQEMLRVAQHCDGCARCKAALEDCQRRLEALRTAPVPPVPEKLVQTVLQRVEAAQQRQRRLLRWAAAAAVCGLAATVLVLFGFQSYYETLRPTPYDLIVLGQHRLLAAAPASLRVRLLDHTTGAALAGMPVTVELLGGSDGNLELARFDTDAAGSGQPRFRLPEWAEGDYRLRVTATTPGTTEVVEESVRLARSWKVMLSSDKPVYQPGQEIHLRALALRRPDLRPVTGEAATFTVTDPKDNVIFKRNGPTSRFGIASADCALANEILEGQYIVACTVGDTASRLAVEVKQYVLPKFKLDVRPDKPFYQPGETAQLTVQADYFFGKPVAGAAVEATMQATASVKQTARTDATGNAVLTFALPTTVEGDANVTFHVEATDTAGQAQIRDVSRVATKQPLRIEVIPEGGELVRGLRNTIYLMALYADGRPARAELDVTGRGSVATDEFGVATIEFMPAAEDVQLSVRARDAQGQTGQSEVKLRCGQADADFLLRTDKAVYEGGDAMHLTVLGGDGTLFLDLLKDGQTYWTRSVELIDGRGECTIELAPELFGTLELSAYRFGAEAGLPRSKTRVVYVRQARQLDLQAEANQREYRPGQKARLSFRLRDGEGKPVPGALSLAAVDEAVFSVIGPPLAGESSFFGQEIDLLQPIHALYPWSPTTPIPGPPAGRSRFEMALFARTAGAPMIAGREDLLRRLLPYVENNERVFAVLDRPNWEKLVPPDMFPPEALAILRKQSVKQTLYASTHSEHVRNVEASRRTGLQRVKYAWIVPISATSIGILILVLELLARIQSLKGCLAVLIIIALFIGLLIPMSPQAVREAAMRTQLHNDLRQISLAIANFSETEGKFHWQMLAGADGGPVAARVRDRFPETLLWRPELITDDDGRASLDLELADSITTWRLSASAVTTDGRLGATQAPIKVFQPFFVDLNLPVALMRGDEVAVPVVVSNYLDKPQTVMVTLDDAPWCERLDPAERRLDLAAGEVRSVHYRLRAKLVGNHRLQVTARAAGVADAVKRTVEVVPDGRRVEQVTNGTLAAPVSVNFTVPDDAIPGSVRAMVKVYPSGFSQLVEGLEGIFRLPSGCFEQTSSTTYPNVLALDYLRRTRQSAPPVEKKARDYIHSGYQRLLTFEVPGGGFHWFGQPPASRTLTAYGLMEFADMARVHDVDPKLIERTRAWLLAQRQADGSWEPEGDALERNLTNREAARRSLATTAYIAWAVFGSGHREADSPTLRLLLSQAPGSLDDPYTVALVANALLALDPESGAARPYLDRLDALKKSSPDGKQMWWEQSASARTTFYGAGRAGTIETTALTALALTDGRAYPATARAALAWLVTQKDAQGTWPSTQATVLSLRALLAGSAAALGDRERRIEVRLGDKFRHEIVVPADQAEVMQQLDLTPHIGPGTTRLTLTESTDTAPGFQVAFRYHVPAVGPVAKAELMTIDVGYDRRELAVGEAVQATATVVNHMKDASPMVMLDLPVPAGFAPATDDFAKWVHDGVAAKYQAQPRGVLVYLRDLAPRKPLRLTYRLTATTSAKVTAPAARVYEYYDPDREGYSAETRFVVK